MTLKLKEGITVEDMGEREGVACVERWRERPEDGWETLGCGS